MRAAQTEWWHFSWFAICWLVFWCFGVFTLSDLRNHARNWGRLNSEKTERLLSKTADGNTSDVGHSNGEEERFTNQFLRAELFWSDFFFFFVYHSVFTLISIFSLLCWATGFPNRIIEEYSWPWVLKIGYAQFFCRPATRTIAANVILSRFWGQ